jgi:DNA-binding beta-propeller fold protein YncE
MRSWAFGAVILLGLVAAGCGGGSTAIGVTFGPSPTSPMTVLVNHSVQLIAQVSGGSTTTLFWQICMPGATPTTQPTNCTAGQRPATGCTIPAVASPLIGYGTITANGLYTAPSTVPTPNSAVIVATSCVKSTAFAEFTVVIDSGIRVQVLPATVTIGTLETLQFTTIVTGTSNQGVSWALSSSALNPPPLGNITPSGFYTAPAGSATITVTATSAADPTQKGTATVNVIAATAPALSSIEPTVAAQGSAQQDIYVIGSNFTSTETVVVTPPAQPATPVPTTFINTTLLRATIPATQLTQTGVVSVAVKRQNGTLNTPGPVNLTVFAVRPALVGSFPDSTPQNNLSSPNVNLTGGFFSPAATTATFNAQAAVTTFTNSRQLTVTVPAGALATPGLYPIVVRNAGIALGQPSISAVNLGVTPDPSVIPTAAVAGPIAVGAGPSAVAIDETRGIAVVANTSGNSISVLTVSPFALLGSVTVGNKPTGVAVDDLLADPVALVVNSADQTVTAVDLVTLNKTTLNVSIAAGATPPLPFSIGVNPLTHRAIVTYQSTNEATILNLSLAVGTPALSIVQQIGGSSTFYSTGANSAVSIDPRLNWAVVTPGGGGAISLVDLGVAPGVTEPTGRAPQIVGSLAISTSIQGVGVNPETHQALLTDPQTGSLTTFSMLNNAVSTVLSGGVAVNQKGFVAAAATPLGNVGIAVNATSATADIVDLQNAVVLQTVGSLGTSPQAVAVDPVSNQAVVVDQGGGRVYLVALGPAVKPLQIVESSPALTVTIPGTPSANLTLGIKGSGFVGGTSQVLLDGTALAPGNVTVVSARKILATVPGAMLDAPRRYIVQVQNGAAVSNVTDLSVVQAVTVGTSPIGVAVDTDRDLAVVTNSAAGTASLVSLAPPSPVVSPESLGAIGIIGGPILTGTTPEGVAVLPRLGLAVVANFGSNNATVVNLATQVPLNVGLCGSTCTGPTGVAFNQDTAIAAITNTNGNSLFGTGSLSLLDVSGAPALGGSPTVDQNPVAVAIDPTLNYAAVATASTTSSVDLINLTTQSIAGRASGSGIQNATGVVFDPVNQMFVVANSLLNNVVIIDPVTFLQTPVRVGIAPMSLDYNFQTSTLVTVNPPSHTMSVIDYVCPPLIAAPACPGPGVRAVIGLGGTLTSAPVLGPNAVAIDPKLNLAVLVDTDNNRVLLVPLPH